MVSLARFLPSSPPYFLILVSSFCIFLFFPFSHFSSFSLLLCSTFPPSSPIPSSFFYRLPLPISPPCPTFPRPLIPPLSPFPFLVFPPPSPFPSSSFLPPFPLPPPSPLPSFPIFLTPLRTSPHLPPSPPDHLPPSPTPATQPNRTAVFVNKHVAGACC